MKIYHPKTIDEAVNILEEFMVSDYWYACHNEWKTEDKMIKDINGSFNILRKQIKRIRNNEKRKKIN